MTLAVKYRPKTFSDVVGQLSTIQILKKQIASGSLRNTYIFQGESGCGKTTMARIFANEINEGIGTPIEIDAASNNGVDNIRAIVRSASERSLTGKYKVIILDEAHRLTKDSWNALLKTIEEPPKHTVFIFCTTEPEKIPDTIKNRCQRFTFTKIQSSLIKERLEYICNQEGFTNFSDSCDYISKHCNNQMRNAITLLEQVSDLSPSLNIKDTIAISGNCELESYIQLMNSILDGNEPAVIEQATSLMFSGVSTPVFIKGLFEFILDINKYIVLHKLDLTSIPGYLEDQIKMLVNFENPGNMYSYYLKTMLELTNIPNASFDVVLAYLLKMTRLEA